MFCFESFLGLGMSGLYVTVVEDRPIMFTKYRLAVTFSQN